MNRGIRCLLAVAVLCCACPVIAEEGDQAWVRCTDGCISSLVTPGPEPWALVGTSRGEVVSVDLAAAEVLDTIDVPGKVVALEWPGAQQWYCLSSVSDGYVLTAGSIGGDGALQIDESAPRSGKANVASLLLSPDGALLAVVTANGFAPEISIEVVGTSDLAPVFSAARLDRGSPGSSSSKDPLPKCAFFGDDQFAYPMNTNARWSVIAIRNLAEPGKVKRESIQGRVHTLRPSKCGTTFRVQYGSPGSGSDLGSGLLEYTGRPKGPFTRLLSGDPAKTRVRVRMCQEIGCNGNLLIAQFWNYKTQRHYRLSSYSPEGRVTLVEKFNRGYEYTASTAALSPDQQRVAVYTAGEEVIDVVDLAQQQTESSLAVDFHRPSDYWVQLGLGGEGGRYAVLVNSRPAYRKEHRVPESKHHSVCIVDLGAPEDVEEDKYSEY